MFINLKRKNLFFLDLLSTMLTGFRYALFFDNLVTNRSIDMTAPKINFYTSIIIPCYNEEAVIARTVVRVKAVMDKHFQRYELIFVNDGCSDRTQAILADLAAQDNTMKILKLSRNFGHQAALSAGLRYCQGELAFIMGAFQ
jgi:cellulose synthase/poly-beta-1,6-N-acetylglucosamine synthase-like glycosyltransferase